MMNRVRLLGVCLLLLGVQGVAYPSNVHFNFAIADKRSDTDVLIAEFFDPGGTGVGKSLSYLVWRELLTAIGNQTGKSVILLNPAEETLLEELKQGRHEVALELAQKYRASMVLWGDVKVRTSGAGSRVNVSSFLTLNPDAYSRDLLLTMKVESEKKEYQFRENISKTRFNFKRFDVRAEEVFARQLITRIPAILREQPAAAAPVAQRLPAGIVLKANDMHGTWFEVRMPEGSVAYIAGNEVSVGPRLAGQLQTQTDGQSRFTMPVEHFVEGLSYYPSRRFEDAYRAFHQFIHWPGVNPNNDNLASAYRWQGASLMFKDPSRFDEVRDLEAFSQAVALSPYDPSAYNIRALARFGMTHQLDGVLEDLGKALTIDNKNTAARDMLFTLAEVGKSDALELPDLEWVSAVAGIERTLRTTYVKLPSEIEAPTSDPNIEGARLNVENYTAYPLNLNFVGVVTRRVEVDAGDAQDIDLVAGEYELAVGFSQALQGREPRVRPMYGIQTYKPNMAYMLKFYLNWQGNH